jgi:hypothetical protein
MAPFLWRSIREKIMHAVIRNYSGDGAVELFDLLDARKNEVEEKMRAISGFVSYALVRTADGGTSVTVCDDKSGTDESAAVARDFISENAADIRVSAPTTKEGSVILHLG